MTAKTPPVAPPAPVVALCVNCPAYKPDGGGRGACRAHPPVALGAWPTVREADFCGEHPARARDASWDAACEAIAVELKASNDAGGDFDEGDVRALKGNRA